MENPLERPVPDDPIKRVQAFACDLAWGAKNGNWDAQIVVYQHGRWSHDPKKMATGKSSYSIDETNFSSKWYDSCPSLFLLLSFGYITKTGERGEKKLSVGMQMYDVDEPIPAPFEIEYVLTPQAFALLNIPETPPKVFVSYKQTQSSALALLIEARLKLRDADINIFIDKLLQGGEVWERTLESRIREAKYFVCLIGPETLVIEDGKENMVRQEIEWASDSECRIIPIWHSGFVKDSSYPAKLQDIQAILVPTESAKGYGSAIDDLLVTLGYSTI